MQVGSYEFTCGNVRRCFMQVPSCKHHGSRRETSLESLTGWTLKHVMACIVWLAWNVCECVFVSGLTWANLRSVRVIWTILTVAFTLINLGSGSGLCLSPTSVLPNPRNLRTSFSASPSHPLLHQYSLHDRGITAVTVLITWALYRYYTFQNILWFHYFFLNSAGR
jgi:hypothetical protein